MKPLPYVRFALALSLATVTGHSLADALHTQVDEVIEPLMREHDIAGMAVAVIADGKEHYFHVRRGQQGQRPTRETRHVVRGRLAQQDLHRHPRCACQRPGYAGAGCPRQTLPSGP